MVDVPMEAASVVDNIGTSSAANDGGNTLAAKLLLTLPLLPPLTDREMLEFDVDLVSPAETTLAAVLEPARRYAKDLRVGTGRGEFAVPDFAVLTLPVGDDGRPVGAVLLTNAFREDDLDVGDGGGDGSADAEEGGCGPEAKD